MSKTDAILDAMGWRLATRPRPQLYVGPSRDFVSDQFEPRLMKLFDEAPKLAALVARGKQNKKTRKMVAGVPVRLAWAGSETSLSSDQAGDVYVDEFDKMSGARKGTGDALGLAKARADTYRDRKIVVTSTPKRGSVETEKDEATGLEFWKVADKENVESPIWSQWQMGTRHHWSWKCPHCSGWFVPRYACLEWPEDATPTEARHNTWIKCPVNGCVIDEAEKETMNSGGQFIAPGMRINGKAVVSGDPEDNTTLSLWVSGLASPFLEWGERVEEVLKAELSGDAETRQAARNKTGELWTPIGGDVPQWNEIMSRREPYGEPPDWRVLNLPIWVLALTAGVDVQKDRLVYVIRGWGARASSWLIEHGELYGDTSQPAVWRDLGQKLSDPIDGMLVKLAFVDSGFRPGKRITIPLNRAYEFCRRYKRFVFPTKGSSAPLLKPLIKSRPDVTKQGEVNKYGLELIRLDSDHWKSFVHERLTWPADQPGAWHINMAATEDYCKQLVSEVRIIEDGKPKWIERGANHFLDCEAMAAAAGFMLNVHNIRLGARRSIMDVEEIAPTPAGVPPAAVVAKPSRVNRFAQMAAKLNRRPEGD